jgi:uncharacterized peroxidase-related enzyme
MERKTGKVINFFKFMANKPEVMRTFLEFYKAVWAPGALSPRIKELGYLTASLYNHCAYCSRAHIASGKKSGVTDEQIQALKDPGGIWRDSFTEEERAAARYAQLLTADPSAVRQQDLDELGKYFNAEQIVELTMIVGTANLTNRFNDGLQVPVDV